MKIWVLALFLDGCDYVWGGLTCLPLKGAVEGQVGAAGFEGLFPEGEGDQDTAEKSNGPFTTLVKNCNRLHNIVGPACIFLKQGFSQTLVCNEAP